MAQRPSGVDVLDQPVTPSEKAAFVHAMFDEIAPRYDLLNSVLSAGIHHQWRTFATRCASLSAGDTVLDVCSGTGDWAAYLKKVVGPQGQVIGSDFSLPMLRRGGERFRRAQVPCAQGDATRLPFADNRFDAVTVAFGIRNVADIEAGLCELNRVTRPGGRVVILEFSQPHPGLFSILYQGYARYVLPRIGGWISGRPDAYTYLPESVARFKTRTELAALMISSGLSPVRWIDLTFGLVCVHVGIKPGLDVAP